MSELPYNTSSLSNHQTGERLHVLQCHEGSVVCVLPLLAIADSSEACLIMTASTEGTMRVSHLSNLSLIHEYYVLMKVFSSVHATGSVLLLSL